MPAEQLSARIPAPGRRGTTATPPPVQRLSGATARRIALAAQGFADRRPIGHVDIRHVRKVLDRIALLQLDSVNVFCRSHYLPVLARLGPYPRELLDRMAGHTDGPIHRELFEYWAHEACLIPLRLQPYLRWRMAEVDRLAWGRMTRIAHELPELVDRVCQLVKDDGPIRASDTGVERGPRRPGQMWNWHDGKVALEYLFWAGQVTAARRINFERRYDLTEHVLPDRILAAPTPSVAEAQRELIRSAARACGVATEPDLGDYFRLSRADSRVRVAELVSAGELIPVEVEGWRDPAYLTPDVHRPRRVAARALLSPFDSLIWSRQRTERLFGFRYRVEIYTPAAQRVHGYYVLPFLLGDSLVARVDLKSDRQVSVLRVQSAFAEPHADIPMVARELAAELRLVADWLELSTVVVSERGNLAAALARTVAAL